MNSGRLPLISQLILFVGGSIGIFLYWNMSFYYYLLDEMTMLSEFYDLGWDAVWRAQNEHFVPFFKILLFGYTGIFGNAVLPWRDLAVLVHVLTVWTAYFVALSISSSRLVSLSFAAFFAFCPLIWETMYMQSGLATTSSVFTWLLTILLFLFADDVKNWRILPCAYLMLILQSFTFGNNLFYPLVIIALYILKPSKFRFLHIFAAMLVLGLNLWIFFKLGSFQNNQNFLGGNALTFDLILRMITYFSVSFYANFGRALIGVEPSISSGLINFAVLIPFLIGLLSSLYAAYKSKELRPLILTGWINYGLVIGLISVSRYRLPYEQALSSRYIYLIMPGLLLLLVPTLKFYFAKYDRAAYILLLLIITRYCFTYSGLQRERFKAESLHARNYQLIVYAKDHSDVQITDFLTVAGLPTDRVTAMLNQYEAEKLLFLDHRIPEYLKASKRELQIRLKPRL